MPQPVLLFKKCLELTGVTGSAIRARRVWIDINGALGTFGKGRSADAAREAFARPPLTRTLSNQSVDLKVLHRLTARMHRTRLLFSYRESWLLWCYAIRRCARWLAFPQWKFGFRTNPRRNRISYLRARMGSFMQNAGSALAVKN